MGNMVNDLCGLPHINTRLFVGFPSFSYIYQTRLSFCLFLSPFFLLFPEYNITSMIVSDPLAYRNSRNRGFDWQIDHVSTPLDWANFCFLVWARLWFVCKVLFVMDMSTFDVHQIFSSIDQLRKSAESPYKRWGYWVKSLSTRYGGFVSLFENS